MLIQRLPVLSSEWMLNCEPETVLKSLFFSDGYLAEVKGHREIVSFPCDR